MSQTTQLILAVDITDAGVYPTAAHPAHVGLTQYRTAVQQAAAAHLDFVLLRDQRALGQTRVAGIDALSVLARLAPEIAGVGLAVAKSVSYTEPFTVARELATLDFVSGGRAAWLVMALADDAAAQNYGEPQAQDAPTRSAIAREYIDVSRKLWDSWEDDAVAMDVARGWFINPHKLHHINHRGEYFAIRGPAITYRPPQGHVVVIVSDTDVSDVVAAVDDADVIVQHHTTLAAAQTAYANQQQRAQSRGREVRILQRVIPVIGTTTSHAYGRVRTLEAAALAHGWQFPAAQVMAGTVTQVADQLALWFHARAADGFVFGLPELTTDGALVSDVLIPEFQRRGLFRTAYTGSTLRSHLGLATPANQYAGAPSEAFLSYEPQGGQA
jgi:alkanesulfonate monooxygenase SsuD/methylene tetrahydromethanopterin reductase-like flavin-dependent oxidoreductase (luciferase family)